MKHARALVVTTVLALGTACGDPAPTTLTQPCTVLRSVSAAPARVPDSSRYDVLFQAAAREFGVPASLLRSIGYVETRWQMVHGEEEFAGQPAAHGVMALRGPRLARGARLARATEKAVRTDPAANIRAAAALLRSYADSMGVSGDDAAEWAPVAAEYSGIAVAAGRESYAQDIVAVQAGQRAQPSTLSASRAALDCTTTPPVVASPTDQPGATWRASPNYNTRMAGDGGIVHMVIIHSCEGGYSGCWSWLTTAASEVSAHYVVREDGAEISQLVREPLRAWHIGATYDASLNGGHELKLQGVQSNHFTIGVEHGGYASQTLWPTEQIDASARLVCEITKRWQIPRDRQHIVSHGQLQPYNRTDPGSNFPWDDYMARINKYCAT